MENKPSTGVLFKNDRKETDSHPDYKGSWTNEQGQEMWLNCWLNESKNGQKYMKLSASPKEAYVAPAAPVAPASFEPSDEIPF